MEIKNKAPTPMQALAQIADGSGLSKADMQDLAAWSYNTHHATITDMAKRLEAAERNAARWRYLVSENNKGMHGKYRICWLDPRRDGFITTDGVSCDGKDEQAIVRIIDAAMGERHGVLVCNSTEGEHNENCR